MIQLVDAQLKIDRANHHIARLNTRIKLLEQSDLATIEINPKFGNKIIKHDITDRQAIRDIALLAGDAVHNLRCALDYIWIETVTQLAPNALGNFAKFPVCPTQGQLKAALCGKSIDRDAPRLFDVMLTGIKSYRGGNDAIWPIHRLDIRDKHRLLIPVIFYSSISGIELEDETGCVCPDRFSMGTNQQPPWYIPMPLGVQVKNKGQVSIAVEFEYGDAGDETTYADELSFYSRHIAKIMEKLEALITMSKY